jgi:hypothetical protein
LQEVCRWQQEAFARQKKEFDKRAVGKHFGLGDIVYIRRPHSGPLAQKFQAGYEGPTIIQLREQEHNNLLLQDCQVNWYEKQLIVK